MSERVTVTLTKDEWMTVVQSLGKSQFREVEIAIDLNLPATNLYGRLAALIKDQLPS